MTVDPTDRPVMIAATAAVVPRMRITIARAAAQRTRPPRRRPEAAPLATTGAETAQATSFSWSGSVLEVRPAGVTGVRVVSSSPIAAGSVPGFCSSVIVAPSAGSSPAGQRAEGRTLAAAGELLHELLHLEELLHEPVDVRQGRARAGGDPPTTRAVEDRRIASLGAGHRPDDPFRALEVAAVDGSLCLAGEVAHARDHRHDLPERAHLLHLLHRIEHVVEGERPLPHLLFELGRLLLVDVLLGPLDEGHDVAHAEDPAREAVRVEDLQRVGLLPGAEELDRDASDGGDGQRCA